MDGVLVRGNQAIPGAAEFIRRLYTAGAPLALRQLDARSQDTVMIGDRMDTDIIAGMESGMETILVLSGVTRREDVERYAYRPSHILETRQAVHSREARADAAAETAVLTATPGIQVWSANCRTPYRASPVACLLLNREQSSNSQ